MLLKITHYGGVLVLALHSFLDGNKRVAFASVHTFLLGNGYDLHLDPLRAAKFLFETTAKGEFRFTFILKWLNAHLVKLA